MTTADNPFFTPSDLPYQLPPFDRIEEEHFAPAFARGMAEHLAEVEAVATNPEPPTFDNTVVALERAGQLLHRVSLVFFNRTSSDTNETIQRIEADVAPQLSAHDDAIHLDRRLFGRVRELYEARDSLDLDAESTRLLERYHTAFVRAGAELDEARQEELRRINEELSTLSTRFQKQLLADTNDLAVVVDDAAQLAGLAPDAIAAAAEAARRRGLDGYVLTLVLPTGQPALASLADRDLRRRLLEASEVRGRRGNVHDTSSIVVRIAALRARRAQLLGYRDHASYVAADQTAGSTEAVGAMLARLAPAAVANARVEAAQIQAAIAEAGEDFELRAWDWALYSERVRRARFDVDADELRPYFELERVLHDGVFYAASRLYGLRFSERHDLPRPHPDIRMFEVFDEDGSPLGLFLGDYHARDSKRGGAWMSSFVRQSRLLDHRPVVVNTLNIPRPPDGEPTLLTFSEVTTMFHEFGHALHGLLSDVRYPRFTGTAVPRDFVEFPSQVNEMWASFPEVLANYACHHRTGEPLGPEPVQRLLDSQLWGEGFATTEYLAATLLDQAWHQLGPDDEVTDVAGFEAEALRKAGVDLDTVPPRYRSTYFSHIFGGGYSAAYYAYIWAEVLDADAAEWFVDNGGLDRANGRHFRREVLSRGFSVDPTEAYRTFRGRDPRIEPLLKRRGLTAANS